MPRAQGQEPAAQLAAPLREVCLPRRKVQSPPPPYRPVSEPQGSLGQPAPRPAGQLRGHPRRSLAQGVPTGQAPPAAHQVLRGWYSPCQAQGRQQDTRRMAPSHWARRAPRPGAPGRLRLRAAEELPSPFCGRGQDKARHLWFLIHSRDRLPERQCCLMSPPGLAPLPLQFQRQLRVEVRQPQVHLLKVYLASTLSSGPLHAKLQKDSHPPARGSRPQAGRAQGTVGLHSPQQGKHLACWAGLRPWGAVPQTRH